MSELAQILAAFWEAPAAVEPIAELPEWWSRHRKRISNYVSPVLQSAWAGFGFVALGHAFASGYEVGLSTMVEGPTRIRALCASESGGLGASAIETELSRAGEQWCLRGKKTLVTLGSFASELLVVAQTGVDAKGRKRLRGVIVPADAQGVEITTLPPMPFVPEIPHASIEFHDVRVPATAVLPGDGYLRVLKPFRSVEDLHVLAALYGWWMGLVRRHDLGFEMGERVAARLAAVLGLATIEDPLSPQLHAGLAGAFADLQRDLEDYDAADAWAPMDPAAREAWMRDRALLMVAQTARYGRRDSARSALVAIRDETAAG